MEVERGPFEDDFPRYRALYIWACMLLRNESGWSFIFYLALVLFGLPIVVADISHWDGMSDPYKTPQIRIEGVKDSSNTE